MKSVNLQLQQPIRIIPINGETNVTVVSTGDYLVAQSSISEHRVRAITLADTGKATLTQSPMGMNQTLKIILASVEASEEEFLHQAREVFRLMKARVDD